MLIFLNIFPFKKTQFDLAGSLEQVSLCSVYRHFMPVIDTHQAKSMASKLLAILGFCINGGEKDGKCVEL